MTLDSCPDPEALAAWLDQGVDAGEREQIEAHLATCDDCRLLIGRVLETQNAVAEAPPATATSPAGTQRVVAFPRRKILWGVASGLAAAAVLLLAVGVPLRWWPPTGGSTDSKLAGLAAAVRDERTVEARLTGGFSHGPLRAAVRSGGSSAALDNWTLLAAASKIREDAANSPTGDNLHALGVAHLLLGEYDAAVRAFEDAIAESPQQTRYQSDLGAAYMTRGRQLDRPDDFPRSLDAAERALKGNDALLEARFNRALALEALFLTDQARAAWEDYLTRDSSSGWASEARTHLQKLQQALPPGELARNNSPPPITDTSVEAGLDWLLRYGLPRWADAVLASDSDRAAREHLHLTDYAKQLTSTTGDTFPIALVEDSAQLSRDRAQALRSFAAGLTALDADDVSTAASAFASACADVAAPLAVLCDVNLGAIDVQQRRDADAERRASNALRVAGERQWVYPLNLAKRLVGYRSLFKGDYSATVIPYAEGFQGFQAAKYLGAACILAVQLADLADVVGVSEHGWRWRLRALELAAVSNAPACWYLTRLQLAGALVEQRRGAAASLVVETIDPIAVPNISDLRRVALGVIKGRIALAADERQKLQDTVGGALGTAEASGDFRVRRLVPDLLVLQAALFQREGQRETAQETVTAALEQMGPERAANRAAALLVRAGIAADDPRRLADAEHDVQEALQMLETRVGSAPVQPLRLEEAAVAFQTIASLVQRRQLLQSARGLWLVERLRQVLNGRPPAETHSEATLETRMARLPRNVAVVTYLLSSDATLTWVRTPAGWHFAERSVTPGRITQLLNTLTVQINRNPAREDLWRPTLIELYDHLLRGLPGVEEATEIAVVPDGLLNRVPFGALFDAQTNQYVFERAVVRVAPNLAFTLAPAPPHHSPASAAVIGDPRVTGGEARRFRPLPRARAEARGVARLYQKAAVVVDEQATKSRVLEALDQAEVVHYAGHAIAGGDRQGARLLLAGDVGDPRAGLTPADVAGRLTKPVRVVLAACETGATSVDRATGLSSLSTALLRAGAVSVVATLWDVDDAAGEMFFSNVHRALAAGQSTATAVARAQRACRADEECRRAAGIWVGTNAYGAH